MSNDKSLRDYLDKVRYNRINKYIPSEESVAIIMFIQHVFNANSEDVNTSPMFHYIMADNFLKNSFSLALVFRGAGKSTFVEALFYYAAIFGGFKKFKDLRCAMYVTDTKDNGGKTFKESMRYRWEESPYLQDLLPIAKFTEDKIFFQNKEGHKLTIFILGINTAIRGKRANGKRVQLCVLDDLLTDQNVESEGILTKIANAVYKAILPTVEPKRHKFLWVGTPFNDSDPISKAAISPTWNPVHFPVCERFPCTQEEFVGAWEERFEYSYVKSMYDAMEAQGETAGFSQEYMLNTISADLRVIPDKWIKTYPIKEVEDYKNNYTFYILTDFAYTEKQSSDYSAISVWAYRDKKWYWFDGYHGKDSIDTVFEKLFDFVKIYNPVNVVLERNGQQAGIVTLIKQEMNRKEVWFNIARMPNKQEEGFTYNTSKLARLNAVKPQFAEGNILFPKEYMLEDNRIKVLISQLKSVTIHGIKSSHDDMLDTLTPIVYLIPYTQELIPQAPVKVIRNVENIFYSEPETPKPVEEGIGKYLI